MLMGCSASPEGRTYPLTFDETYTKLYGISMMREVCQQDYGIQESSVRMEERGADRISWIVSSRRGQDWYRLTANLAPAPEGATGTAVALKTELILKDDGFGGSGSDRSLGVAEASAMFREKTASTLEGRPFDFRRVAAEVDAHLGYPTPPEGTKRVDKVQDVAPHLDRYAIDSRRRDNPPANAPGERAIC